MRLGWMHARKRMPCNTPFPSPGMRRSAARKVLAVSFSFAPATNARLRSRSTNTSQNGRNNALPPNAALKRRSSPSRKYPASNSVSGGERFVFALPVSCAALPPPPRQIIDNILEYFGTVAHLHDGHAASAVIQHFLLGFFQHFLWQNCRSCGKIIDSAHFFVLLFLLLLYITWKPPFLYRWFPL